MKVEVVLYPRDVPLSRRLERSGNEASDRFGVGVVVVWLAWPEESPQSIAGTAGDHMNVEVGHSLTYHRIRSDERTGSVQGSTHRARHSLHYVEDRAQFCRRHVFDGVVMGSGDHEYVARE
jgi:hypothetical protein